MRRIILLSLLIFTPLIHAEIATTHLDSIEVKYVLDPVVKTATKTAHAQRDLAASISVISRFDLESAPSSSVLEILQQRVPGMHLTEWGVMGFGVAGQAAGKISMRGFGGGANTHVLILRNGRPDFMGLMGCTIADEFSTDGADRVEVIRGPGSFLYGTNATGGIINIIPARLSRDGFETQLNLSAGAFGTQKYHLRHAGKRNGFEYQITASHRQSDGHRSDSEFRGDYVTFHTSQRLSERLLLEINANWADMRVLDPGPESAPADNHWYDITRGGGDLNLTHTGRLGDTYLKLHTNLGKHHFFDGWRSTDRTVGVMLYHNIKPFHGNITTVGFDIKEYGGDARDAGTDYDACFLTEYAPYFHTQQLFFKRFIASAGLRLEHHELYGSELLPKAGLVCHMTRSTALRGSVAKGFRSPSIRELYFWGPANPELEPDRVWNYEIGIHQKVANSVDLDAAYFQMKGENLIQFSGPPPLWVNSGEYDNSGLELSWHWLLSRSLQISGAWTKMRLDDSVFNTPEQKLSLSARGHWGRYSAGASLISVSGLKGANFPGPAPVAVLHDMDDYTVLNLSAGARIFRSMKLNLHLKNMLDTEYQSMYGYPMPGRHLLIDLDYTL